MQTLISQLQIPTNPLLSGRVDAAVPPDCIQKAVVKRPIRRQSAQDYRRDSAVEIVKNLERDGMELFGLTRGQFSLSDLIEAVLDKIGPAEMEISTWTAAHADVERMMVLMESGKVTGCRWLVDQTFVRRVPELAARIRETFGDDSIRVTRTHAKFVTLRSEEWAVALRSSMNLNQNPRLESFQVAHDPELCDFLSAAFDDVWRRQDKSLSLASTSDQLKWYRDHG
ncbi:hypothetical protein [Synechococcus sp. CS-205]|uniref:hypothetical protein n=1 Tax=Synechococcus sp. CS-205 TaxID=2847984 RepID=UPI00223BD75F|nr:hypothetical protein [Synechococcus sp. CS-205]MCT0247668.1 hypothetical protein [Synechococcus sp. CS-205]